MGLPQAGDQINKYTVLDRIGGGVNSAVYRVRHDVLHSLHALKIYLDVDEKRRERMRRSAEAQAQLRDENIAVVSDVIDVDGQPGIVMQLVGGETLAEWAPHVSLGQRLQAFEGVLKGVRHAHRKGMVHRSLHPGEIRLDEMTNLTNAKILDFWSVKTAGSMRVTEVGDALGELAYTAPEQHRDASSVDARADIFSLGAILYELVTGRPPFAGSSFEIMRAAAAENYTPPDQLVEGLPVSLVALITEMLRPKPEDRISSVDDALVAVRQARDELVMVPAGKARFGEGRTIDTAPAPAADDSSGPPVMVFAVVGVLVLMVASMFLLGSLG